MRYPVRTKSSNEIAIRSPLMRVLNEVKNHNFQPVAVKIALCEVVWLYRIYCTVLFLCTRAVVLHGKLLSSSLFSAAGEAFCRAASVQIKCGSKHEAATQYVDASTCYKKSDPAGISYNRAIL